MVSSLKLRTFENIGYNAFGKAVVLVFQVAANVVLARNLSSSDYGIVGFALIFTAFLSQLGDMGVQAAVVREEELDDRGLYTGFAIKVVIGLALLAAAAAASPLARVLFDQASVENVVRVLAVNFAISSFAFLPTVALTRDLDYRKLLVPQVASAAVNSALAIVMAKSGYGYWSIVAASVASTAVYAAVINVVRPVKWRFLYDGERAAAFLRFGGNLTVSGLLVFLLLNVDNFAIGTVKGARTLGYYAVAFNWGTMACGMLAGVVLSVLFPTFSRFQGDRRRLREAYLRVLEYVGFAGLLANAGLFVVSREFLLLVLGGGGDKWLPALASLRILCLYGVLRLLMEPVGSVVMAIGRPGALLKAQAIIAAIELALLYPALRFLGIEGVAAAVTVAYASAFVAVYPVLRRELGLTVSAWAAPALPAVLAALVATAAALVSGRFFPLGLVGLAGKAALFAAVYCAAYGMLTRWRMAAELRDFMVSVRRGFRGVGNVRID